MNGTEFLALAAVVGAGWWAADVAINPRSQCRACDGTGRHQLSRARAYGNCPKCKGRGQRLRVGARWVRRDLRRAK